MYDEYGNYHDDYDDIPVSHLASGFGFRSDREFDDCCDEMEQSIEGWEFIDRCERADEQE